MTSGATKQEEDPFRVIFKQGSTLNTGLYYVDHTQEPEMAAEERQLLSTKIAAKNNKDDDDDDDDNNGNPSAVIHSDGNVMGDTNEKQENGNSNDDDDNAGELDELPTIIDATQYDSGETNTDKEISNVGYEDVKRIQGAN